MSFTNAGKPSPYHFWVGSFCQTFQYFDGFFRTCVASCSFVLQLMYGTPVAAIMSYSTPP